MTRLRSALALIATGVLCGAGSLVGAVVAPAAHADDEPGSGLGSFALSASSPALQLRFEEPTYCFATPASLNGCEGVVPEAVSSLQSGPIGFGLAAVAWPGSLAGNAGSLLITAGGSQVPDSARQLNDPVRAEARIGSGPDVVTYDQVPGTTMRSVAKSTETSAEAAVGQSQTVGVGTFGKSTGSSVTRLTGKASAEATALSSVSDIDIAGVLHIDSVTSTAKATTTATSAQASGRTVVTGATVANVPVTIDEHGVSVAGNGSGPLATKAVTDALKQAGLTIALTDPQGKPDGADVDYSAGTLFIVFAPPSPQAAGYSATVAIGGANVSVSSSPAFDTSLPATTTDPFVPAQPAALGGTAVTPPLSGPVSTGGTLPQVDPGTGSAPAPVTSTPLLAAARTRLPGGLSPWLGVTAVLGAGLVAAGLRRLPDQVLAATGPVCPLEENR